MRNLKRALSLAMASVMVLGLMVVGTGASYKDVASDKNVEAIEVLQAVGVMVGDENGNFNPDQNVTRNEMAVVMANLMDYRVASYSGTSPFTDVPSWAEPYVAACYTNGITSGMSATTYGGDQTVTTAQAALMLMKALGYFQTQSDFGDDWQLATVSQGTKIDLFVDVDSGVREAMTRNDVAQLVLNTLEAGTVEADDNTIKVEAGDVSVEAGKTDYIYVTSGESYATAIESRLTTTNTSGTTVGSNIVQLGEKLYQGDLKMKGEVSSITDGFNAPSRQWSYKNAEIGTYADKADYVFEGSVKGSAMYASVGKTVADNYTWHVYLDGDRANGYDGNGNDKNGNPVVFNSGSVTNSNNGTLKGTGRGTTTYVYLDDDVVVENGHRYAGTATVCIVQTYAAEVIQVENGTITLDDNSLEFDIEGYEEGDMVLYTKSSLPTPVDSTGTPVSSPASPSFDHYDYNSNTTVESVLGVAEYVEGEVTQVKNTDTVVISDTTYNYNTTVIDGDKITVDAYNQTVGFYLDQQGNIVKIDKSVETGDYAYVLSMGKDNDKYGEDNFTVYAKLVLADGTVVRVEVDKDSYEKVAGKNNFQKTIEAFGFYYDSVKDEAKINAATSDFGSIVSYVVNESGTYDLTMKKLGTQENASLDINKGVSAVTVNGTTSYGDANTVYIICEDADNDEFSAYVGYKNVPDIDGKAGTVAASYANSNGVAKFVYVTGANTKASADDIVYVIGRNASNTKLIKSSVGNYYEFAAVVNGETSVVRIKENSNAWTAYDAAMTTANGGAPMSGWADKTVLLFAGATTNSSGLTTDLTIQAWGASDDLKYVGPYTGIRRQNSAGLIGFNYNGSEYQTWMGADDDALVVYYDYSGNTLGEVGGISDLKTDINDKAYIVTDKGSIIAILVEVH